MIIGCRDPPKCRTNDGLISYLANQEAISNKTRKAMKKVDRINYIPKKEELSKRRAYWDSPQSIGHEVTISQPSLVGKMIDSLELQSMNNVLEIGTGSAYNAAIISKLLPYGKLTTVERVNSLGKRAKKLLKSDKNVTVIIGDAMNHKYKHKFDRIIVTAEILDKKQIDQLIKLAGAYSVIIVPYLNILYKITKCGENNVVSKKLLSVRFVPVLKGIAK